MGSKKRSAKARQVAEFKASLDPFAGEGGVNDAFAREQESQDRRAREREAALRNKACESKNRYASRADAEQAMASCADYGVRGLHCYRCDYCNGWHLTSKPERGEQG